MKTMYLCIHALQVIPASCINRDDTGTPKNCIYGGTSRMRVSSQCWKRAIRMYMKEKFKDSGVRTKLIADELANRLTEETGCSQEETLNFVKNQLDSAGIIAKDKKATAAFFSDQQIDKMYSLLKEAFRNSNKDTETKLKKELQSAVIKEPSVSELLFGRMFATDPSLNYDAACQVAHAFSVNEVVDEPDYFTVVGDIKKEESLAGSDFLDTKLFNSGILYRFSDVNLSEGTELRNEMYNINAAEAAKNFLEAFILSMPTGSVNGYANLTLPDHVIVELREDFPVSFAPAFSKAIIGDDICEIANNVMTGYEEKISRLYGAPVKTWTLGELSLREICDQVEEEINRRL